MLFGGPAVPAVDCMYSNLAATLAAVRPGTQLAGYSTGSGGVPWPAAEFDAHPGTLRICQDPSASDHTADLLDDEQFAASDAVAGAWGLRAEAAWKNAVRPGQRWPAVYRSASGITSLVNAFIAAGVTSNMGLVVANWNLSDPQAIADVLGAAGPFPVVGIQWRGGGQIGRPYDLLVLSGAWLSGVSGKPTDHRFTTAGETLGELASGQHMNIWAWLAEQRALNPLDAMDLVRDSKTMIASSWWTQ